MMARSQLIALSSAALFLACWALAAAQKSNRESTKRFLLSSQPRHRSLGRYSTNLPLTVLLTLPVLLHAQLATATAGMS